VEHATIRAVVREPRATFLREAADHGRAAGRPRFIARPRSTTGPGRAPEARRERGNVNLDRPLSAL